MKNFKPFMNMYIEDFKEIAVTGKKENVPDKKIEELQEKYFEALIRSIFKCSNMPKEIKLIIIEKVKKKIQTD